MLLLLEKANTEKFALILRRVDDALTIGFRWSKACANQVKTPQNYCLSFTIVII